MAALVPLSRFTSRVGGGSAFYVRHRMLNRSDIFLLMFRIANLFVAFFFFLCVIVPDSWCYGPFNPCPPPPSPQGPVTVREIIVTAVTFVWFVSAVGLFFRSRLAWFGCLLGVGLDTWIAVCFLIDAIRDSLFPNATDAQHMADGFLLARIMATATVLGMAIAWSAISVGLVIGLTKSRKELRWI